MSVLYSRFLTKFLASIGECVAACLCFYIFVKFSLTHTAIILLLCIGVTQVVEPFKHLITQGMVHGETFKNPQTGSYVLRDQVVRDKGVPQLKAPI